MLASVICMSLSAIYHLFYSMCPKSQFLLKLDFIGIFIVIYTTAEISYFYGFHCDALYLPIYLITCTLISIAFLATIVSGIFAYKNHLLFRTYAGYVSILVIPAFHLIYRRYDSIVTSPLLIFLAIL